MSGTCPFAVAAAVGAYTTARLAMSPSSVRIDAMTEAIKHPGNDTLIACRTDCQLYSTCIPTGEGFTSGCMLAPIGHYRA